MTPSSTSDTQQKLDALREEMLRHTEQALEHMERHGVRPEGQFGLFLPPEARQQAIARLPYEHQAMQQVVYEAAQEDITAYIYEDLMRHLENPAYLVVTTAYNVRGGIRTTCTIDSRSQGGPASGGANRP